MNRLFLSVIALLCLGCLLILQPVWANDLGNGGNTGEEYATGDLPPTPEVQEWIDENMIQCRYVRLNPLGFNRINTYRTEHGLLPLVARTLSDDDTGDNLVSLKEYLDHARILSEDEVILVPMGREPIGLTTNEEKEYAEILKHLDLGALQALQLPPAVDNSQLACFPPIRSQGSLASSASFSTTYYTMTHMVGLFRGWENNNPNNSTKFSPKWTYNMINWGRNGGSIREQAIALMLKHGAANWEEFPYDNNYREWSLDPNVWRHAIDYRMQSSGNLPNPATEAGLAQAKKMLLNGYILNFGCRIFRWQFILVQDDPTTPEDDPFVGDIVLRYAKNSGSWSEHAHDYRWLQ